MIASPEGDAASPAGDAVSPTGDLLASQNFGICDTTPFFRQFDQNKSVVNYFYFLKYT